MKKSILLSLALLATSLTAEEGEKAFSDEFQAYDTPVNYNYAELFVGQIDTIDDSPLVISGGGEGMITKNWIYDLYYTGATSNTVNANTFAFGGSYRFSMMEKLDLLVGADLIYGWGNESGGPSTNDFGFGVKTSLRYGFTPKFEGLLGLGVTNLYDNTGTSVTASLTYYFNNYFGLSGRVIETFATNNSFTYGASLKFRF